MEKNNMHGGIGTYDRAAACHITGGNVEKEPAGGGRKIMEAGRRISGNTFTEPGMHLKGMDICAPDGTGTDGLGII